MLVRREDLETYMSTRTQNAKRNLQGVGIVVRTIMFCDPDNRDVRWFEFRQGSSCGSGRRHCVCVSVMMGFCPSVYNYLYPERYDDQENLASIKESQ